MSDFRGGFLLALAENGLTPSDLDAFLVKKATLSNMGGKVLKIGVPGAGLAGLAGMASAGIKDVSKFFVDMPVAATLGLGLGGGALLGGGAVGIKHLIDSLKNQPDKVEEYQRENVIRELALQHQHIKRRMALAGQA